MPMRAFVVPEGAAVVGNAFSDFISASCPPPPRASQTPARDAALAATLEGGVSGGIGQSRPRWPRPPDTDPAGRRLSVPRRHRAVHRRWSIAMSVLTATIPSLKELTKDPVGQHTVKQYTRYITLAVAFVVVDHRAELKTVLALGFEAKSYARCRRDVFVHVRRARRGVAGGRDDRPGFAGHVRDDHRLRVQCTSPR